MVASVVLWISMVTGAPLHGLPIFLSVHLIRNVIIEGSNSERIHSVTDSLKSKNEYY
jgi:hypothetical protein